MVLGFCLVPNMSDSKLFVFGSFTEEETRSWLQSQSSGSVKKPVSSRRAEKPAEDKELQFGSLNFGTESSLVGTTDEPNGKSVVDGPVVFQPSTLLKKDDKVKSVGASNDHDLGAVGCPKENGHIKNSTNGPALSNGVNHLKADGIDFSSFHQNAGGHANPSPISKFHVLCDGNIDGRDQNAAACNSSISGSKEVPMKAINEPVKSVKDLLPRGLINSGNLCFLNATLQALMSCSPFVQLLQELRTRDIPKAGYPTLTAFVGFVSDFDTPSGGSSKKKNISVLDIGRPFSPSMFEAVLKNFTPDVPNSISGRPRQEDAQEFLSFIMDQMHDELLKLQGESTSINGANTALVSLAEEDEWETVGPKNKSAVTRTQSFLPSALSDIFGGQLKSVVKAQGNKASATVQPFLLLHIDIYSEAVHTIEDALRLFSAPENLEGYRTSSTGNAGVVTAKKSVKIQTLSKILILHLMRFSYGSQGSTKLHKSVRFPLQLVLGRDLLVTPSAEGRKYELVATVTHHGRDPSKGHYTTDARYFNDQWLHFDDASVTAIGTSKVLHDQAYVLFYKQV